MYICNYTVARGVLEHSGRSPFRLCAVSLPFTCLALPLQPHPPSVSSLLHPYLFVSISLIFAVVVFFFLGNSTPNNLPPLNSGRSRTAGTVGSHLLMIRLMSSSNLRGGGGSPCDIHSGMHNTKDQSWVNDRGRQCCLGWGCRARAHKQR